MAGQAVAGRADEVQPRPVPDRRLVRPGRDGPGVQGAARRDRTDRGGQSAAAGQVHARGHRRLPAGNRGHRRLKHPKLVAALDAGQDGNVHYLVTEYVPGKDLRQLVREDGPLGMAAAAWIILQVAEGLEYAHGQGFVHRDVKPGNVLVSPDGQAKLSDLGLAGPVDGDVEDDPRYGKIVGTADYLSPDQVRDPCEPEPAWDIYSLGCTLYYAVTGKVPFPGRHDGRQGPRPLRIAAAWIRGGLNFRLSPDFVEVMADMMAKEPARADRPAPARSAGGWSLSWRPTPCRLSRRLPRRPSWPSPRRRSSDPRVRAAGLQHGLPARQRQYALPARQHAGFQPVSKRGQGGRATTRPPGNGIWPLALLVLTPIALVAAVLLVRYLVIAMLR